MTPTDLSHPNRHVSDLVKTWDDVAKTGKDAQLQWLHHALETAIRLEFSTIPPYLMALWSIKDQQSTVASAIKTIVQEEMVHMALACNMLVAIGGTPPLNRKGFVPTYPGPLPGGIHAALTVSLSGLTRDAVKSFLIIERPEAQLTKETDELMAAAGIGLADKDDIGIGVFYDAILTAFRTLSPPFSLDRQVKDWDPIDRVQSVEDVEAKISLIKEQGEGTSQNPHQDASHKEELAHFYRFLEIHACKEIDQVGTDKRWGFTGKAVAWPDVWPVALVPAGGYDRRKVAAPVADLMERFDTAFGLLLQQLHHVWTTGDDAELGKAIGTMGTLREPAIALMQIPIPGSDPGQTYAPSFRLHGHAAT
jgi:hypothetical protein